VQSRRDFAGFRCCLFARSVRCRLVHSKARRWMATAQGGTQTCGERTCTPFDQLSHSGTPRPEWRKWQATAGFLAHGSSPAPPSRANDPVVLGAGFPLTVAGAAPASLKPGNLPRVCRARYSLLVLSRDKTPSAADSIRRTCRRVNPLA
jgi:hypothetical protein